MPVLNLGIVDVPYAHTPAAPLKAPKGKRRKAPKSRKATQTTGDVAEILEAKYHVMELFYEERQQQIADALAESAAGMIENLALGAPLGGELYGAGQAKIETLFRQFLESSEIERLGIPGVPTKAALDGVGHRFKGKRGPRRPSFVDTGLYGANFADWVE